MIENLIEEFRSTYQDDVTQGDFNNILDQFGRIDIRCALDDGVKEQIYQLIQERQNGHVSYGAVETLILEFLIQQNVTTTQQSISTDNLGLFAQKLPLSMLESVTFEFLNQFKNLYKLIQNKYGNIVDYRELERLAKELQRTMKINSIEMVRYIQPLGDNQQKVKVSDILGLVNDFEKMLNEQNRASVGFQQPKNTNNQVQVKNLSSDEEAKHHNDNNERLQKRELANKIYQNTDLLRQKLTGKKEIQCLNDINKSVQILESFNNALFDEIEKIHKKNEELSIEKELSSGQLQQFQLEITSKDQQIQQLLEDNDYFQAQMNTLQDQCDSLRGQCEICNEQLKSVTLIETELKQQQIDNKHQLQLIQKQKIEIERLTQNNHSLMKIITELENKVNENVEVENTVQKTQQPFIQQDTETIQELQQLSQDLQEQLIAIQKEKEGLEVQIIDLKREIAHYKKLYENTNTENQYLRSSIMPRDSCMGPHQIVGRMSKLSVNGLQSSQRIYQIGRVSSQRISSIRGNQQTAFSNFNPLEDVKGEGLKISQFDEDPQQKQAPPGRLIMRHNQPYENSILEEDEDQTVTVKQTKIDESTIQAKNSLVSNFNQFWNGLQKVEQQDSKCIEFDEEILYSRDFAGVRDDPKIIDLLKLERKVHKQIITRCFSDTIYRIDAKGKRSRRIIFLTEYNFYIFEGEKKPGKLTRQFPITNINTLILSEISPVLCCLKISGSEDYLIETFKRSELNVYLTEIFASQKMQLFRVDFLTQFKIKLKGCKEEIPVSQVSHRQGYLDQGKASAFKVSQKQGSYQPNVGWLHMFRKKMFQGDWQEVFAMLTNVGLILFKKPGDLEPILFVSIVDAIVIKNPIIETNKQHLMKIRYESSDYEFVFSVTSVALLNQWHDMLQTAIMEQVRQQNKYLDFQQQQVLEQRTQTLVEQEQQK